MNTIITKRNSPLRILSAVFCGYLVFCGLLFAEDDGLAPEVTDLNAQDVSMAFERKIPYLETPYINTQPKKMDDDIPVGALGVDGGDKEMILSYASEVAKELNKERKDKTDSLLISYKGKLIFESYYRRGRQNLPHFQMSITKSNTAFALGRAIQLGHLSMDDLNKPVVDFLKDLDRSKLVDGAAAITLAEALNMSSGIRLDREKIKEFMNNPDTLKGQGQIQAYFECSEPSSTLLRVKTGSMIPMGWSITTVNGISIFSIMQ